MTECVVTPFICNSHLNLQTHLRVLAADFARALLHLATLSIQEGAGKAGCRLAPTVRCALVAQKEFHSGIQVKPNTRPSLRSGLTAYAVLSREPSSFWPPSPRELMAQSTRLGSLAPPQELDRSDDGQDHTVLPYAHSLTATEPDGVVHTATGILARRTFSAAHPHEASGSRKAIRPAPNLSCRRCRVHRNPARER